MTASATDRTTRQGVVVVVPTTDQPILLRRLSLLPKIPTSRVVLGNETSDQCEGWTRDYNNMLRPDAPARALLGLPEAGGYRLVVGADIDHGKSWMMPVLAAHAATARDLPVVDRLAQARALIWTTGAVNLSYADTLDAAGIIDDDYHLKSKIDRSRTLFADAAHAGTPVICLLPDAPGAKEAATWAGAILKGQPHHIRIVKGLAGAVAVLDTFARRGEIADLDEPDRAAATSEPPAATGRGLMPLAGKPERAASQGSDPGTGPAPQHDSSPEAEARAEPHPSPQPQPQPATPLSAASNEGLAKVAADLDKAAKAEAAGRAAAAQPPKPAGGQAGFPGGMAAVLGIGIAVAVGALAYMALYPAPPAPAPGATQARTAPQAAATVPATTQPIATTPATTAAATPATTPVPPPPVTVAPAGAAARIGLLKAPAGRSCQALVMDMSPRYEEGELLIAPGQAGLEIDRSTVCGVTVAGLNQVSARFVPLGREVIVPSLSVGNRLIFNPTGAAGSTLTVELSGAQTGQVVLTLR